MSTYAVHKVAQLLRKDPAFRDQMQRAPADTLAEFRLTDEERQAILTGDVGRLLALGAHGYLLGSFGRAGIGGLTMQNYSERAHSSSSL
jgi:hypothetical protein